MTVDLQKTLALRGEKLKVRVTHPLVPRYQQIQLEIYDVAVPNPSPKLGFGVTPENLGPTTVEVEIDTQHLTTGFFEIRLVRLHSPVSAGDPEQQDFVPIRDYERKIFEVGHVFTQERRVDEILALVVCREAELERSFAAPVDIRRVQADPGSEFATFVFVKDVLIGTRVRLDHLELLPTHSGLDTRDTLDFVNSFLR